MAEAQAGSTGALESDDARGRLLAIGYRMLGSRAEAEDAVQDTYARLYRLDDDARAAIEQPTAWLTTVMTRVCLNVLGSARRRRETYVGEWLPEPVPLGAQVVLGSEPGVDPAERAATQDGVTMALMVVLEALSPGERVAFVLHDVFGYSFDEVAALVGRSSQSCRKLASTARRHVEEQRRREAPVEQHRRVVESFTAACRSGDVGQLVSLLDPQAVAVSDGGGVVSAAQRPVRGQDRVARFLVGAVRSRSDELAAYVEHGPFESRVILIHAGGVVGVASFEVVSDAVSRVWLTLNPDKLRAWPDVHIDDAQPVRGA